LIDLAVPLEGLEHRDAALPEEAQPVEHVLEDVPACVVFRPGRVGLYLLTPSVNAVARLEGYRRNCFHASP